MNKANNRFYREAPNQPERHIMRERLWSEVRSILLQGAHIRADHANKNGSAYDASDEYSAAVDCAASERADRLVLLMNETEAHESASIVRRRLPTNDDALEALRHLVHNIKASKRRIDLGMALHNAERVIKECERSKTDPLDFGPFVESLTAEEMTAMAKAATDSEAP